MERLRGQGPEMTIALAAEPVEVAMFGDDAAVGDGDPAAGASGEGSDVDDVVLDGEADAET